jgi:hypothetical protein
MFVDLLQRGPLHVGANHSNAQEESAILQEKKKTFLVFVLCNIISVNII